MNRRTAAVCLIGLQWTCQSRTYAGQMAQSREGRSVLAGVAALTKPVSYTETKIPLGELVQRVAADTGVTLRAAREVADEPVAVVVRAIPAHHLLAELGDLLDYQWSRHSGRDGPWYEIAQDMASRYREQALREASAAAAEHQLRDKLRPYAEVASLPEQEILALRQAALQGGAETGSGELAQRLRAALWLASPVHRSIATLFGRLSPDQWATLLAGHLVAFSTAPQPGEFSLPDGIGRAFRSFQPTMGEDLRAAAVDTNSDVLFKAVGEEQAQWADATGYRVVMRIQTDPQERSKGSLRLDARAVPIVPRTANRPPFFYGQTIDPLFVRSGAPPVETERPEATDARDALLRKDPLLGAKKPWSIQAEPRFGNLEVRAALWRLSDLLPQLARTYGVQFISDSYWSAPSIPLSQLPPTQTLALFSLLDRLVGQSHQWDHEGDLVRLRSRTWFLDRPREIPMHLVREWQDACERRGALTLGEYVDTIAPLTDTQMLSLGDLAEEAALPSELFGLSTVYDARNLLRLYATLGTPARQALGRIRRKGAKVGKYRSLWHEET